ncbi:amidohydrolase family protein [Mycobacterium intracellulare 1956]|uniref:Amidohydrolase family protein n=1 Tax=Mycobacterium intracellulare 1956 TaxID=1299331 RepID=X8CAV1_MYCIT|nr:amidohydrolase family protein [Mycobacterium intracellulare 1956]
MCAEYDALPEIGHACGHNIIAASAVGTALALAEVADELGLRVALLGTPAEEAGGGKALLLRAGVFDDIAAAVMLHPGPTDIAAARSLALSEATITYRGTESHAAVAPHLGINAADAVTVAQVAVGLLRQQLAPGQLVHGIVTDGGQAVNVIPGRATLQYAMRAVEADSLRELEGRMYACFAAGALATGCEYDIDNPAPAYDELTPDQWLADVFREEMRRLGREPVAREYEAALPMGSTDMGNVTKALPGIHPVIGLDSGGAMVHQRGFAEAATNPSADRAVIEGAIMLARTVVQLAQTPAERDRVMAAHERRRGGERA